jgi:hypothetical protein
MRGDAAAAGIVVEAGRVPSDSTLVPALLYLTGQWERYDAADPDGTLLGAYCAQQDACHRGSLRRAAKRAERPTSCPPPLPARPVFDPDPSRPDRPRLQHDGSISWRGNLVDVERDGLPTLDLIELPATSAGVERGRSPLTSTSAVRRPDRERCQVAVTLADQTAATIDRAARPGVDGSTARVRSSSSDDQRLPGGVT